MTYQMKALEQFMAFEGEKYISPAKAGDFEDEMLRFKTLGQKARASFQALAKLVAKELPGFNMDRISQWMNQAQIGRPHFWCYFWEEDGVVADPTFAIRMKTLSDGSVGLSVEVSFIERGVEAETIARQNQVLNQALDAPVYYWVQMNGESHAESAGNETGRLDLIRRISQGEVRKVLVKYDVPLPLTELTADKLVIEIMHGIELLRPSYQATKN